MKLSFIVAVTLIFAGAFLHWLSSLNHSVFLFINSLFPNANFWKAITTLGDGAFAGCIFYLIFRKQTDLLAKGLIGAMLGLAASEGLKRLFAIPRPEHSSDFESSFHLLTESMAATNYSMPSGHIVTAFLLGTFLLRYLRLNVFGQLVLVALMATIAVSRIALGVHWPADVFVGAGLGILIAVMCGRLPIVVCSQRCIVTTHILYFPFALYAVYKYIVMVIVA